MSTTQSFNMVLFGGTGDLVMRKLLPALYQAHRSGSLGVGRILCLGRRDFSQDDYLSQVTGKAKEFLPKSDWSDEVWATFAARIAYVKVDAENAEDYPALKTAVDEVPAEVTVYYLSTSPSLFTGICQNLAAQQMNGDNVRVVLEKPLGHDLSSSNEINQSVGRFFKENQIYRIDHYLGKESVQNLMALRFGNALFDPLWRREWISDVQITIAEEVGIEKRGGFYDHTGALKDMVQNHLLQMLCFVAMEPPFSLDSDAIRDEKLKVLRALVPYSQEDVLTKTVRGQYKAGASRGQPVVGYLQEDGVATESKTETFVALRCEIANWRWAGVPFFLRTGKRMADRLAEIVINFRDVPHQIFPAPGGISSPNKLVIRLQPEEHMKLYFLAKAPGDNMRLQQVHLDLDFAASSSIRRADAYERLLLDTIRGNLSLFVRQDELEQAWKWVEPIMSVWSQDGSAPKPYTAGTWGPAASSALLSRDGLSWHEEA
ncbi:glucose-6-phosphate dehydrogenase [Leeia sp. TBRC 13508]|uniref:Glucose-6-phosphate 1-dehydrogenase n=1 Tax=Leeia speluncae TaxID=2884804 RepID=A0ABS8DBJ0_9NEIS|nr:glucose-6-phosphate dehydrogenase [Leeia speluncae]MCB6185291.1 glucose-6-phosphate dehydrogenase [Leeia speluncae]